MYFKTILVCGGRDYANRDLVFATLDLWVVQIGEFITLQGGATGADALAAEWADSRELPCIRHPARWKWLGHKGAGHARNEEMLKQWKPDAVLAFPGGTGTHDMKLRAKARGVHVTEVTDDNG